MRISFISQVTRVHKATTVENDTSLCSTILVLFLEFSLAFSNICTKLSHYPLMLFNFNHNHNLVVLKLKSALIPDNQLVCFL